MEHKDIGAEEKKAGKAAAAALKAALVNEIKSTFNRRSGKLEKTTVTARYKYDRLDRLVMSSPKYSFTQHFGSQLAGAQKATVRKGTSVKSFSRHIKGGTAQVRGYDRKGGLVKAMNKNERYKAHNHISRALSKTSALNTLADALGQNRSVLVTSQINF